MNQGTPNAAQEAAKASARDAEDEHRKALGVPLLADSRGAPVVDAPKPGRVQRRG